jgi:alpha-galactosidase
MKPVKLVVIGAGSADFGPAILADVLTNPAFEGSTLSLVDIEPNSLRLMTKLAQRMNQEWASGVNIEAAADRKKALPDADFVLVAVEVERMERWRLDFEVALKHGLRQPFSENGGPGGFAHAARNIAIVMDICKDMRRLCPDAWFFNYTNPVPRIALAANKYGGVKAAGFCHGIGIGADMLGELLGIPEDDLELKAAGLNHFTWVLDARRKSTGKDIYPALRRKLKSWPDGFHPLTRDVFETFGLFPFCGDSHIAEYLQWVSDPVTKPWEKYHLNPPRFGRNGSQRRREEEWRVTKAMANGEASIDWLQEGSGERACHVAAAIAGNTNSYELAINIPNEGYVPNLPQGAIVEVPAVVSALGIRGVPVGNLPEPIAELCRRQTVIADLVVKAAATGDKKVALHALLMDPMVTDIPRAQAILDDYLTVHGDLLPQFRRAPKRGVTARKRAAAAGKRAR